MTYTTNNVHDCRGLTVCTWILYTTYIYDGLHNADNHLYGGQCDIATHPATYMD